MKVLGVNIPFYISKLSGGGGGGSNFESGNDAARICITIFED